MEPDMLCQKIGQWFRNHKDEEPFAFGEVHLLTGEPQGDILLVLGKIASETPDQQSYARQWENTIYDHPVTWLWQQLAREEADTWLYHIYESAFHTKKRQMLEALLELATLIESSGYHMEWEAEEGEEGCLTEIVINRTTEPSTYETERWKTLLQQHG